MVNYFTSYELFKEKIEREIADNIGLKAHRVFVVGLKFNGYENVARDIEWAHFKVIYNVNEDGQWLKDERVCWFIIVPDSGYMVYKDKDTYPYKD